MLEYYPGTGEVSAPYTGLDQRLKIEVELGGEVQEEVLLLLPLNQRAQKYLPVKKACQRFTSENEKANLFTSLGYFAGPWYIGCMVWISQHLTSALDFQGLYSGEGRADKFVPM